MRVAWFAVLCTLLGCSPSNGAPQDAGGGDLALPPGTTPMRLIEAPYAVPAGTERYFCQWVTVPQDTYIVRIASTLPPGVHHETLSIEKGSHPDGAADCTTFDANWVPLFFSGVNSPELDMPENVALVVSAGQQIVLNLHLTNPSESDLSGTAAIDVAAAMDPAGYQSAGVTMVANVGFTVPQSMQVDAVCTLSADTRFFAVFPHMHLTGAHMKVWVEGSVNQVVWDQDYSATDQRFGDWAPLQLKQGDRIRATCSYSTDGIGKKYGSSTSEEMCVSNAFATPPIAGLGGSAVCIN